MSYSRQPTQNNARICLKVINDVTQKIKATSLPESQAIKFTEEMAANAEVLQQATQFAKDGDLPLQRAIAKLYLLQPGNKEEYLKWLEISAKHGHPNSIIDLALCFHQGQYGLIKSIDCCVNLLQIVIESTDLTARQVALEYINQDAELKSYLYLNDVNKILCDACARWNDASNDNYNNHETMAMFYYVLNHRYVTAVIFLKRYLQNDPLLASAIQKYSQYMTDKNSTANTKVDYFKLTNKNNLSAQKAPSITKLKNDIYSQLKNPKSSLYSAIKELPMVQMQHLLSALIQCDSATIATFLSAPLQASGVKFNRSDLLNITEHARIPSNKSPWLNDAIKKLIMTILTDSNNIKHTLSVRRELLRFALQGIPDKLMSVAVKRNICQQIDKEVSTTLNYIAYDESLQPLQKNRFSGKKSE